jgi:hypothetical protein
MSAQFPRVADRQSEASCLFSSQDMYRSMWKYYEAKSRHSRHSFGPQTSVIGSAYQVAWVLELCVVANGVAPREPSLNLELELWQWMRNPL